VVTLGAGSMKARSILEPQPGWRPIWAGWITTARLHYRLSTSPLCAGVAQLDDWTRCSRHGEGCGVLSGSTWGIEGLGLPCADSGGARRGWFVFVVQLPRGVDRDADDPARSAAEQIQSKPYLPAIHLMSFYRERLRATVRVSSGLRGRCPRAPVALPFLPEMSEGRSARVAEQLRAVLSD